MNDKCDWCDSPRYIQKLNSKGILLNYCYKCLEKERGK